MRKLADLETSLTLRRSAPVPRGRNVEMHELANAGLVSQIEQLEQEIRMATRHKSPNQSS
jgi:hypothetical protein